MDNFQPLEFEDRGSETQPEVVKKSSQIKQTCVIFNHLVKN